MNSNELNQNSEAIARHTNKQYDPDEITRRLEELEERVGSLERLTKDIVARINEPLRKKEEG